LRVEYVLYIVVVAAWGFEKVGKRFNKLFQMPIPLRPRAVRNRTTGVDFII
jgi:hypothetical protein